VPVEYENVGRADLVTIENTPLNFINQSIRAGLDSAIDQALAAGVDRLIFTGRGSTFIAGADAREFDAPTLAPHLNDVLSRIAGLSIPTIAAINGTALGGGLELAIACSFRIAKRSALLSLPEVKLGIVPGAGGTQRLPRLIGISFALGMITDGHSVTAADASAFGLVDMLSDDPVSAALSLDEQTLLKAVATDKRPPPLPNPEAEAASRKIAARKSPGQRAPIAAIGLVAASSSGRMEDNLAKEREVFLALRESSQSKALRHVFFSERAAVARGRSFPKPESEIASAIVVGGGNMGSGIAYSFATAGISVALVEADEDGAVRATENVRRLTEQGVSRGSLSRDAGQLVRSRVRVQLGFDSLPPADLAIEAVYEDAAVKGKALASLEAGISERTVLATNTSYLDIEQLADGISRPGRFVGLHFFSPAHVMKLLEIVRGARTSAETLGFAFRLARMLDKVPVLAGVCEGFIGNRILKRYRQEADTLLLEGALPSEIDAAMRGFGMAMGPYEAQDLSGLDIAYANRKRSTGDRSKAASSLIADRLVEDLKRLGRKSGAGWYDYAPDGTMTASNVVQECILTASRQSGISRRAIAPRAIVERLTLAMIDEGCSILDEGIAAQPRDIDLVLVHGYGFPRWRGGLMHYADRLTPRAILARLKATAGRDQDSGATPDVLVRLAEAGKSFESLNNEKPKVDQ
jgi:3-hydroxyacyl-CoA dehydrogenase